MIAWLFIYILIIAGLCYLAVNSEMESNFVRGIVLFILCFMELWTIGRIIVNPVNRIWAIAMCAVNAAAMIYLAILNFINR